MLSHKASGHYLMTPTGVGCSFVKHPRSNLLLTMLYKLS